MFKNLLLSAALLLPATAFAAPAHVVLSPDKAVTMYKGASPKHTLPNWHPPKGKTVIINTLGDGDAYDCCNGWTISNSGSAVGIQQWFAYAITPSANTTITEIVEAVGYVSGTSSVTVALLADNGGTPGKTLAKKSVKDLETFGDCCGAAMIVDGLGLAVIFVVLGWIEDSRASTTKK